MPKSEDRARVRRNGSASQSCTVPLTSKRREQIRARAFRFRVEVFVSLITQASLSAQSFTKPHVSGCNGCEATARLSKQVEDSPWRERWKLFWNSPVDQNPATLWPS